MIAHSNSDIVLNVPTDKDQIIQLPPLFPQERAALEQHEATIGAGLQTFFEVGLALIAIRDAKLFREFFATFEEYCRKRWSISRAHAYRLVNAAELKTLLSPMGDKIPLPENERQIRPLTGLSPKVAQKVWSRAFELAGNARITERHVKEARLESEPRVGSDSSERWKESWQMKVKPLLEEALKELKNCHKAEVEDLIYKVSLQLSVGSRKAKGDPVTGEKE